MVKWIVKKCCCSILSATERHLSIQNGGSFGMNDLNNSPQLSRRPYNLDVLDADTDQSRGCVWSLFSCIFGWVCFVSVWSERFTHRTINQYSFDWLLSSWTGVVRLWDLGGLLSLNLIHQLILYHSSKPRNYCNSHVASRTSRGWLLVQAARAF